VKRAARAVFRWLVERRKIVAPWFAAIVSRPSPPKPKK
jgi:hypothetical protein